MNRYNHFQTARRAAAPTRETNTTGTEKISEHSAVMPSMVSLGLVSSMSLRRSTSMRSPSFAGCAGAGRGAVEARQRQRRWVACPANEFHFLGVCHAFMIVKLLFGKKTVLFGHGGMSEAGWRGARVF